MLFGDRRSGSGNLGFISCTGCARTEQRADADPQHVPRERVEELLSDPHRHGHTPHDAAAQLDDRLVAVVRGVEQHDLVARLDLEREGLTDYSGPVGEAKLAWRPGAQTTVRLEALRDATYSIYESNQIYLRKAYDLRVVRYFNRLIGVEADLTARWGS